MSNNPLLPIFSLIAAALVFFLYVGPTWRGPIAEAQTAIASDEQALAAAKQYATQQDSLDQAKNAINQSDLDRLTAFLPDSVDNVGIILDLNALAARSSIALSSINVSLTSGQQGGSSSGILPSDSDIGSVDLTLSASGTFAALQEFLTGIEKSARILDVRQIAVHGSDIGVYGYQMTIRLYWLR